MINIIVMILLKKHSSLEVDEGKSDISVTRGKCTKRRKYRF